MPLVTTIVLVVLLALLYFLMMSVTSRRIMVGDHEAGLLYVSGKWVRTLPPGGHWLLRPFSRVERIDLRSRVTTIPAQEVLTADNVSVKTSLLVRYKVVRPEVAVKSAMSFEAALYADAQVALREVIGAIPIEELVTQRDELSTALEARVKPKAEVLGLELEGLGVKDFVFPPLLRQVFHQVVEARKASQASLERARGETATLRSLANAARMLENNPALLALKTLQTVADGKHTVVLGATGSILPLTTAPAAGGTPRPPAPAPDDEGDTIS